MPFEKKIRRNETLIPGTAGINLKNIIKVEEAKIKHYLLYDSIQVKCPEQANPRRQTVDQYLPRAGSENGSKI